MKKENLILIIFILVNIASIQINYWNATKNTNTFMVAFISVLFFIAGFWLSFVARDKAVKPHVNILNFVCFEFSVIAIIALYPVLYQWVNWVFLGLAVIIVLITGYILFIDTEDDEDEQNRMSSFFRVSLFYVCSNLLMYFFNVFQTPNLPLFLFMGSCLSFLIIRINSLPDSEKKVFTSD